MMEEISLSPLPTFILLSLFIVLSLATQPLYLTRADFFDSTSALHPSCLRKNETLAKNLMKVVWYDY